MSTRLLRLALLSLLLTLLPAAGTGHATVPDTVSVRLGDLTTAADQRRWPASAEDGAADAPNHEDEHGVVSAPVEAQIRFTMVGLDVPAGAEAQVRTSQDGRTWGPWYATEPLASSEGPDTTSPEATAAGRTMTEAMWVGPSRWLQVSVEGAAPEDVDVVLIDPSGLNRSLPARAVDRLGATTSQAAHAAGSLDGLTYVSRSDWGADESLRNGSPRYASTVSYAVVHHTAGSNDYRPEDGAAIVRGIYHYHTRSLGWNDIGYNMLVDKYGRLYEGRAGGLDRAVSGAHAAGFNSGSFGISVMGSFGQQAPAEAALAAVAEAIAWKFLLHGVDPYGEVTVTSGGSPKYAAGTRVTLDTIIAHRDVGRTSCNGDAFYRGMANLRGKVAERMSRAGFLDIGRSVHSASIQRIADGGITNGCSPGRYCPTASVTRGQMATFLARTFALTPMPGEQFPDVPPGHVHAETINAVVDAGFAAGYPDGRFRPELPISREQMATMLQRGLGLPWTGVDRFFDTAESRHREAIAAIEEAGITGGCDTDLYCPVDPVTREQMATFLDRVVSWRTESSASDPDGEADQTGGSTPSEEPEDGTSDGATADGESPPDAGDDPTS